MLKCKSLLSWKTETQISKIIRFTFNLGLGRHGIAAKIFSEEAPNFPHSYTHYLVLRTFFARNIFSFNFYMSLQNSYYAKQIIDNDIFCLRTVYFIVHQFLSEFIDLLAFEDQIMLVNRCIMVSVSLDDMDNRNQLTIAYEEIRKLMAVLSS